MTINRIGGSLAIDESSHTMSSAERLALAAILVGGAFIRLFALGEQPFWLDEAHTLNFSRLSAGELWSFSDLYARFNPPGYILFMKIWSQLGTSDWWLRMSSALAGIATIAVTFAAGRRAGGIRVGLWASAFLAVAGYHIRYSQEARAYALITLCAALALWATLQLVTQPEADRADVVTPRWHPIRSPGPSGRRAVTWTDVAIVVYGLATGAALHLHNTAFGIILAANVGVGIWWLLKQPRPIGFVPRWLWSHLIAFLVFLPWIPGFIAQLGAVGDGEFWVPSPTPTSAVTDVARVYDDFIGLLWNGLETIWFHLGVLALAAIVVAFGARALDGGRRIVVLAFVIVQPTFEILFSLRSPVLLSRTLIWIVVGTAICFGAVMVHTRSVPVRTAAVLLLAVQIASTVGYHTSFEKTAWDEAAAVVADNAGSNDVILVLAGNTSVAFDHYYEQYGLDTPVIRIPWNIPDRVSSGSVLTDSDLELLVELSDQYDTTWLVLNSVGNIQNGAALAPTLTEASETSTTHRFTDVRVMEFD